MKLSPPRFPENQRFLAAGLTPETACLENMQLPKILIRLFTVEFSHNPKLMIVFNQILQ